MLIAAATLAVTVIATGPKCSPHWAEGFVNSGVHGTVRTILVFDDDPLTDEVDRALYIAGDFLTIDDLYVYHIARWDGTSWSALGQGTWGEDPVDFALVEDMVMFDDGSGDGPSLYVSGQFDYAGGQAISRIARWNGSQWLSLGTGVNGSVTGLTVWNDGTGSALYAGGGFTTAGGVATKGVARWNGATWAAVGGGLDGVVTALAMHDDGSGSALYVAGNFTTAGGVSANDIARWNGTNWFALGNGAGFSGCIGQCNLQLHPRALVSFDDGKGPALYVGGALAQIDGVQVDGLACWNGTAWSSIGGVDDAVLALIVYADPISKQSSLYVGGQFDSARGIAASHIARWDGRSLNGVGAGANATVYALRPGAFGEDAQSLFVGGAFSAAGDVGARNLARWDGTDWHIVGHPAGGMTYVVYDLEIFDDGSGERLFAVGGFDAAGAANAARIAAWDGTSWSDVGGGFNIGPGYYAYSLEPFDDGNGPALYAGGGFYTAGGLPAQSIARWNGKTWSDVGGGMNVDSGVYALTHADKTVGMPDGAPMLYAGGSFETAGGVTVNGIARWDGVSWSALGGGVGGLYSQVQALAIYDDGDGPQLYAGGYFSSVGGVPANGIARWNGKNWSAIGAGATMCGTPHCDDAGVGCLFRIDDSSFIANGGPALYIGGNFLKMNNVSAPYVARWDGSTMQPIGNPLGIVWDMAVFDDGKNGPSLYAGANDVLRWNGTAWVIAGDTGMNSVANTSSLEAVNLGQPLGSGLYVGGNFSKMDQTYSDNVAKLVGCAEPVIECPADIVISGAADVDDLLTVINSWGTCSKCAADISPPPDGNGEVDVDDLLAVINQWGTCK